MRIITIFPIVFIQKAIIVMLWYMTYVSLGGAGHSSPPSPNLHHPLNMDLTFPAHLDQGRPIRLPLLSQSVDQQERSWREKAYRYLLLSPPITARECPIFPFKQLPCRINLTWLNAYGAISLSGQSAFRSPCLPTIAIMVALEGNPWSKSFSHVVPESLNRSRCLRLTCILEINKWCPAEWLALNPVVGLNFQSKG